MTIAYHVDRVGSLQPGKISTLPITGSIDAVSRFTEQYFPDGVSAVGAKRLDICPFGSYELPAFCAEAIFECVRMKEFPNMPSRFTSFFAARTQKEAVNWFNTLSYGGQSYPNAILWEVEYEKGYLLDARWRDIAVTKSQDGSSIVQNCFSFPLLWTNAQSFWSGEMCNVLEESLLELMLPLPVSVKNPLLIGEVELL